MTQLRDASVTICDRCAAPRARGLLQGRRETGTKPRSLTNQARGAGDRIDTAESLRQLQGSRRENVGERGKLSGGEGCADEGDQVKGLAQVMTGAEGREVAV